MIKKKLLNLIASIVFLIVVLGGFVWVWSKVSSEYSVNPSEANTYQPIDVSGIKDGAEKLIEDYENNAGIPISTPNDKLEKQNPFSDTGTE